MNRWILVLLAGLTCAGCEAGDTNGDTLGGPCGLGSTLPDVDTDPKEEPAPEPAGCVKDLETCGYAHPWLPVERCSIPWRCTLPSGKTTCVREIPPDCVSAYDDWDGDQ